MASTQPQITALLEQVCRGQPGAWEQLMPLVMEELRALAQAQMARERGNHTLQPTALVNEAFLRLAAQDRSIWQNRSHFFGAAARAMRRVLVDHARAQAAAKRGGENPLQVLDDSIAEQQRAVRLLDLDSALTRLCELDPVHGRIVELRFFGGLTIAETAEAMDVSESTVERGWRLARAWLMRELEDAN